MQVDTPNRAEDSKLRSILFKAEEKKLVSKEEIGFITALVNRYRSDLERKVKQLYTIQGEMAQLKNNELMIVNMLENVIAAADRDEARQETMKRIRGEGQETAEATEGNVLPSDSDE
jgi:deoxyribodipyrimidine photolyase